MSTLHRTLQDVVARIAKYRGQRRVNEQNTKATLIEPVLRALGWDLEDLEEVQREFKPKRRDNPVDYALFELRSPRLFLEAKALGEDLNDRKWAGQIFSYAAVAGVEWVVLSNGREYRIYNAHAPVGVEDKLFRSVDVATDIDGAHDTLKLISKTSMAGNRLEALWRAHFVDQQVRAAVESAFAVQPDPALVRLFAKRIPALGASDVRASLTRMRMELEFPLDDVRLALDVSSNVQSSSTQAAAASPTPSKRRTTKHAGAGATVKDLITAGLLPAGASLSKTYRGEELVATVQVDGTLLFRSEAFQSPSAAGAAARAHVQGLARSDKLPSTNGWEFWSLRSPDGSTITLSDLRRRLDDSGGPTLRMLRGGK